MGKPYNNDNVCADLNFDEEVTLSIICGKWKFRILYRLVGGPKRFNELQRDLKNIAPRTLTNQLRELESCQIVVRKEYPQIPPKVEYSLSDTGQTLIPVLQKLGSWGSKYCGEIKDNLQSK
ncbi:MAG: winged helix-turn-helix transcriptional regulator [Thermodesulfobacteriota bacterium]